MSSPSNNLKDYIQKLLDETITELARMDQVEKENSNWANPSRRHYLEGRRDALLEATKRAEWMCL